MLTTNIIDSPQFDYVNKGDPTIDVNPRRLYATWLNLTSGELFICTDATTGANVWYGQAGTVVSSEYDPYFDSVELLLHGNGAHNSSSIIDSSNRGASPSLTGTVITSSNHYKFNGSSLYFDGGTYLEYPASSYWEIGTGDFTLETWVYFLGPAKAIDNNGNRVSYIFEAYNCHLLEIGGTSTDTGVSIGIWDGTNPFFGDTSMNYNTWYHIAVSRVSGIVYLFFNGVMIKSGSYSYSLGSSNNVQHIGGDSVSGWERNLWGYIDDLRYTKGVGRYTSDFIPNKVELYSL